MSFTNILQWSKSVKQKILRSVTIYGFPMHLWNDDIFKKICKEIGEVVEINNDLQSLSTLEYSTYRKWEK